MVNDVALHDCQTRQRCARQTALERQDLSARTQLIMSWKALLLLLLLTHSGSIALRAPCGINRDAHNHWLKIVIRTQVQ